MIPTLHRARSAAWPSLDRAPLAPRLAERCRCGILLALAAVLPSGCMAERDSSGEIVTAGIVGVFQLREGDCFNDPESRDDADTLARVDGVPCSEPHHNETYAVFELALDAWPGDDAMTEIAVQECMTRFERYTRTRYTPQSQLDFLPLFPSEESFDADDRGVICFLYDRRNEKLMGSMRGPGA